MGLFEVLGPVTDFVVNSAQLWPAARVGSQGWVIPTQEGSNDEDKQVRGARGHALVLKAGTLKSVTKLTGKVSAKTTLTGTAKVTGGTRAYKKGHGTLKSTRVPESNRPSQSRRTGQSMSRGRPEAEISRRASAPPASRADACCPATAATAEQPK